MATTSEIGQYRARPAFASSLLIHGGIVVLIVLGGLVFTANPPKAPVIFELVAGAGDNYLATDATALGQENGVKFDVPIPAPTPTPPVTAPVEPEPTPVTPSPPTPEQVQPAPAQAAPAPAPKPAKNATKAPSKPRTITQTLQHAMIVGESKIKMKDIREEKERKKQELARKKAMAAAQGMSYDQFEKSQGAARGKSTGVLHGKSMDAGAGGKALTAAQQDAMMAWVSMLEQRWRDNFVAPPDADGRASAFITFYVSGDGAIGRIRVTKSSGNANLDAAIVDALGRVHVPAPPTHKGDEYGPTEFEAVPSQ